MGDDADEEDKGCDWWSGGFPDHEKATKMQLVYLLRRMHIVESILSPEERVAISLRGGFGDWLELVSKERAREIIGRVKGIEDEKRQRTISNNVLGIPTQTGKCDVCGGELAKGTVTTKCQRCGLAIIKMSLGEK
jgi:hypothetical protein